MATDLYTVAKNKEGKSTVISIHGVLGSSRSVYRLLESLATAGFYSIAYDQRGHGHSPHHPLHQYSIPFFAEDLLKVMDHYDIPEAHIVGHSLGGRVGLAAAAKNPGRIKSLTMIDVSPHINPHALAALKAVVKPLPDSFSSKQEAAQVLTQNLHDPALEQFLLSNLRDRNGRLTWVFDLDGIRSSLLPSLNLDQTSAWSQLSVPTLVIRGENSEHFSNEELQLMLKQQPNTLSVTIKNAGHWVHVDNFVDMFDALVQFLKAQPL